MNCLIIEKNIEGFVAALAVVRIKLMVLLKKFSAFFLPPPNPPSAVGTL